MHEIEVDRQAIHLLAEGTAIEVSEVGSTTVCVAYTGDVEDDRIRFTVEFVARLAGVLASGAPLRKNQSQAGLVEKLSELMRDSYFDSENRLKLSRVRLTPALD